MAVSLSGTWMQQLAVSWLMYRLTKSEWMLGLVWFCANVPVLLLAPAAGVAADRLPRRAIVIAAQATAMVQAFVLAGLTYAGLVNEWLLLALISVQGLASAFDIPARQSLFVRLVGKEDLLNAISLNSATFNTARIIGPSLGGFIVARLGETACFLFNGVSYLAVLGSLAAMNVREQPDPSSETAWDKLRGGMSYAWTSLPLRTLLSAAGALSFSVAPVLSLAPVFADGYFNRGSEGLGLLTGAMGVGAVLGTLSLARRRETAGLPQVIVQAGAALGIVLVIYAVSPSYWLCLALMPLIGMNLMRQNAATNTTVQTGIEDRYRGRVMGLYSMMLIGMMPIGSLLAGALASAAGARWTVALGGLVSLGAAWKMRGRVKDMESWVLDRREQAA